MGVEVFLDDICRFSDGASHFLDRETEGDRQPFWLLKADRDDDAPPRQYQLAPVLRRPGLQTVGRVTA